MEPSEALEQDRFDPIKAVRIIGEYGLPSKFHRQMLISSASQDSGLAKAILTRLRDCIYREKTRREAAKRTWQMASAAEMNSLRTIRLLTALIADINRAVEHAKTNAVAA